MIADERYAKIVEITNTRGFISTKELASMFDVTEATIRRDCEELDKKELIIRVHGGAKGIKQKNILSNKEEKAMKDRTSIHATKKDLIAQKAASFVKDGNCIFLDGGTSIVPMLKYLKGKKIKIVTHSHLITSSFDDSEAEVFSIGGKFIPEYSMCAGPITLSDLERFNFDYAFIGCAGLDINRKLVYTAEMDTMAVKQKAMSLALKSYLLVDSSKYSIKGFCSFISTDDFDAIISDDNISYTEDEIPDNFIFLKSK